MDEPGELERLRARVRSLEAELSARADDRAMLRTILESIPAQVLRIGPDGEQIEFINRVLPLYADQPPTGRSIYSFAPPDQHEVMRSAVEAARTTHSVSSFESIALAPDGTRDWYWTVVGPIVDEGVLTGLTLICTDITRAKQAELALRESHAELALALDAGNVGVWRWDSVGDRVIWDDKLCAMFGLAPEAAPRTRTEFLALVSDDQRPSLSDHIDRALSTGVYLDFELRADLPDQVRWYVIKGGVVRDEAGGAVGLLGGVVDDTERRRLEERVREAQKLEALGQLSAGVAHNFNNMLAAIIPAIELVARRSAGPDRAILLDARETALRAAELVRDLMRLSRTPSGEPRRLEPLYEVLGRALALSRSTFGREIELSEEGREQVAQIRVDGPAMEQALLNLLLNARDSLRGIAAPRARIDVLTERLPPSPGRPHGEVRIRIRDTGCGMDEATRARVFEPFFTTKPVGQGTGLGLSTAWATVRAHRGSLSCDSVPDQGSVFTVTLPLEASTREQWPQPEPDVLELGAGQTVLVIDDEVMLRRNVAALLESWGYRAVCAASGAEGLALFRGQPADIVLLDHSMPGQPASVTLSQLRELAPTLPVISFTGLGDTLEGATAHLRKPVSAEQLLATLRRALG